MCGMLWGCCVQARIIELEGEISSLNRKYDDFSRSHSDQLADLQSKSGKQMEAERLAREKRLADASSAHAKALADRDAAHTAFVASAEKERASERAALNQSIKDWESKYSALSTESNAQRKSDAVSIAKLQSDLASAQSAVDALKQQTAQLSLSGNEAVEAARKELSAFQTEARETRERERAETARGLSELRAEHERELRARTREFEAKESAHRIELTRIDENSRNEIQALKRQMQDALDARSSLHLETTEQIERMKIAHTKELSERELALRAQFDAALKSATDKHAQAMNDIKSV